MYFTNEPHGEKNLHCIGLGNSESLYLTRNINYGIGMVITYFSITYLHLKIFLHELSLLVIIDMNVMGIKPQCIFQKDIQCQ